MNLNKKNSNNIAMEELRKIHIVLVAVFIGAFTISCNNTGKVNINNSLSVKTPGDTAIIKFDEFEHDFGKITEGERVACVFTFTNSGKGPLVVASATTSCGCTVSKFDDKPIPPGGKGELEVVFDSSGKSGKQTKTITVKSNALKPIVLLKITAEVVTSIN
jgi:hypothetical protein